MHLKMVGDREVLRPLLRTQFSREPTAENALDFVICLSDPAKYDHESIIEFLADNDDIVAHNDHLQTARAVALFHAGRLEESHVLYHSARVFMGRPGVWDSRVPDNVRAFGLKS